LQLCEEGQGFEEGANGGFGDRDLHVFAPVAARPYVAFGVVQEEPPEDSEAEAIQEQEKLSSV
jgi:hypothetical protein